MPKHGGEPMCYAGFAACGCCLAVIPETKANRNAIPTALRDWARKGLRIEQRTWREAKEKFWPECQCPKPGEEPDRTPNLFGDDGNHGDTESQRESIAAGADARSGI